MQELGHGIILPSSYIGGSQHMFQLYQDSIALIRFFSTVTANLKWDEITQELSPGQQASDRPDLVFCVFLEKIRIYSKG